MQMAWSDIFRLVALGAIWGASFIFMKLIAPIWGAPLTASARVLFAGAVLWIYYLFSHHKPLFNVKTCWPQYLVIAAVNTAIPFCLYSFAAQHIPASYSVLLNATAPVFGVFCSSLWLKDKLNIDKMVGVFLGLAGVFCVVQVQHTTFTDSYFLPSIFSCLGAACCYALAGIYIKKKAAQIPSIGMAIIGQLFAGLLLLPVAIGDLALSPLFNKRMQFIFSSLFDVKIIGAFLGLSLLCSALAYLLYYTLLANVGPGKALTVTFLMPLFGILWANLFLGEELTLMMGLGGCLIIVGTILVLKQPLQKLKFFRDQ